MYTNILDRNLKETQWHQCQQCGCQYEHDYEFCPYRYYERICNKCLDYSFSYEIINHHYKWYMNFQENNHLNCNHVTCQ
jgi:hypothetical protein